MPRRLNVKNEEVRLTDGHERARNFLSDAEMDGLREHKKYGPFRPRTGECPPSTGLPAGCHAGQAATRVQVPAATRIRSSPTLFGASQCRPFERGAPTFGF